jgi:hypothetical protein
MEKKKSSIDWLIEQLEEKGRAWENVSIRRLNISIDVSDYLKLKHQANAMHKEEIVESYREGRSDQQSKEIFYHRNSEQYYNETFGGNNE